MTTLTLTAAAKKYHVDPKRLLGWCYRNEHKDPLVVGKDDSGEYLLLDDWRLRVIAEKANLELPSKSAE